MEQSSEQINPERLKDFVRHLCIVTKKHNERKAARTGLERQIKKVKIVSTAKKPKRWLIDKELKALNNKISLVLEKESRLLGIEEKDSALIIELRNRVQQLEKELMEKESTNYRELIGNREKINALNASLSELKNRIKEIYESRLGREKRIKELEEKIKGAPPTSTQKVLLLRGQIKALEAKYNKMKSRYSREDLRRVEARIDFLKRRLTSFG